MLCIIILHRDNWEIKIDVTLVFMHFRLNCKVMVDYICCAVFNGFFCTSVPEYYISLPLLRYHQDTSKIKPTEHPHQPISSDPRVRAA